MMLLRCLLLILALTWLLLGGPVTAQTLADNSEGRVRVAGNELLVDAKNLDAAAIRLGAPPEQGGLGKISFDVLGGSRTEKVLLIGAQSPGAGGEVSLNLLRPGGGSTDDAMIKVLEVNHEGGFRFRLPVTFEAGTNISGGGSSGDYLASGRFWLYQQGDGNVVNYELVQGVLCARWSIWTGAIPKHTAMAPCAE